VIVRVGEFNTPLSTLGHPEGKKKSTKKLQNNTIDQMNLMDIYIVFHPAAYGTLQNSSCFRTQSKP
jgi:hypothetical protein